jgi:hypothetical protein
MENGVGYREGKTAKSFLERILHAEETVNKSTERRGRE